MERIRLRVIWGVAARLKALAIEAVLTRHFRHRRWEGCTARLFSPCNIKGNGHAIFVANAWCK